MSPAPASGSASASGRRAARPSWPTGRASRSRSASCVRRRTRTRRRRCSATGTSTCSRRTRSSSGSRRRSRRRSATARSSRRGIADDKGQLFMLLEAASRLALAGELPVNVRFACDGEEETGGHSIVEYLAADERGADACVIFDSGMIERDRPAFNIATRGLCYFHITIRTGDRDLHSGMYGGAAMNAVSTLTSVLQAVLPGDDGRMPEPLRQGIAPPSDEERAAWSAMPGRRARADRPGRAAARPGGGGGVLPAHLGRARRGRERPHRRLAAPAEDRAPGRGGRERLDPARARPGSDGDRAGVRAAAPGGDTRGRRARRSTSGRSASRAWSTRRRRRSSSASTPSSACSACGRSDPLRRDAPDRARRWRRRAIPTIITGFSLPDCNIHSPNERIEVEYLPKGIAAAEELFRAFGGL